MAATSRNFTFLLFSPFFPPASQTYPVIWYHTSANLRFLHQSHMVRCMIFPVTAFSPGKGLNQLAQLLSSKPITASNGSFLNFNFLLENFDIQSINLTLYSILQKQIVRSIQEKSYYILVWRRIPNTSLLFNVLPENLMMYHFLILQWHIFQIENLWIHHYIYKYQAGVFSLVKVKIEEMFKLLSETRAQSFKNVWGDRTGISSVPVQNETEFHFPGRST